MNRNKNESDNQDYKDGYSEGRDGRDPATAFADGLFHIGSDSFYSGLRDGAADRAEHGSRTDN